MWSLIRHLNNYSSLYRSAGRSDGIRFASVLIEDSNSAPCVWIYFLDGLTDNI